MHEPSYYRARLFLFDKLIEQLPIEEKEKKNTPRQLLKNGYWSPELGYEQEEIIKSRQFDVNGEDPLKLSEITRYSTWFAMHPEKVCGKEVVTSSMFFPVKIEGTDDDVKDTVKAGIRAAKGETEQQAKVIKITRFVPTKAKESTILSEIGVVIYGKENRNDSAQIGIKYEHVKNSEGFFTFTDEIILVGEKIDNTKPFFASYCGDNNANRYERVIISRQLSNVIAQLKIFDEQECIMQTYNPESKLTESFTIYPFANTYNEETLLKSTTEKKIPTKVQAPEPVKKPAPNLLRMRLKAKALKLKFKLSERHIVFDKPEYVTRQNTDLQKEFDYFNHLCFDDSLQSVPMQWGMSRDKLGAVCYTGYTNKPDSWIIKYLEISLFNKIRYKDFVDTLVHEMIHVFIIQNRMRDTGMHGVLFMKEAARINKFDIGINITVTGDTSGLDVSDDVKRKEFVVALVYQKQKQYGIAVYNRALHNDIPRWYDSLPKEFIDKNQFTFKVVVSDNPALLKVKSHNVFNRRSLSTIRVNEAVFTDLENSRTLDGIQDEQIKLMIIH